jgi:hypothetical protein
LDPEANPDTPDAVIHEFLGDLRSFTGAIVPGIRVLVRPRLILWFPEIVLSVCVRSVTRKNLSVFPKEGVVVLTEVGLFRRAIDFSGESSDVMHFELHENLLEQLERNRHAFIPGFRYVLVRATVSKSEGADFSFEISAPSFRFFEDLVRLPDHNKFSLQNCLGL